MKMRLFTRITIFSSLWLAVYAVTRTSPPGDAVIVRAGTTTSGEFATIASAVASLPSDTSAQTIFIFPGTYEEQVLINRKGPVTVLGYTEDTMDFSQNQVVITHSEDLTAAGSDDASGTLRVKSRQVSLYNIDVRNDFGPGSQAIALSAYGSQFGAYACRFIGYQDTLYSNEGTQVYLKSYIEGAVDFIFGREGIAFFADNVIATKGAGCVTASGRQTDNSSIIYVFDQNTLVAADDAFSNVTAKTYLGRPWADLANVVFKNTVITAPLNDALWSIWSTSMPNTDQVFFAEFNSTGPGVANAQRPSFSTILTSDEAAEFTIETTLGSDYATWVDASYLP